MEENNPSAQAPLSDPSAQAPEPGTAPIQPQQPPEPAVPETPTVPPQGQKSNTILWVALILLVLSLLGGVGYFLIAGGNLPFLNQQKACTQEVRVCPDGTSVGRSGPNCEFAPCPTLTPSPSLTPDPTANWKTYTNTSANYSIKYPSDWTSGNVAAGSLNQQAIPKSRYIQIWEDSGDPKISTGVFGIEELQILPPSEEKSLTTEKTVNGIALKCNGNFTTDTKTWCWVKVPNMEKYLNIQIFKGQDELINQTFDQILSTFKFLEATPSSTPSASPQI